MSGAFAFTVPDYEISSPTYHKSQRRFSRWRRSSDGLEEKHELGLGINAFGRAFNLSLSHNKNLLAPNFKIEILRQRGTEVSKRSVENCHYTGVVHQGGSAAISNCGGLVWFYLPLFVYLFVCLFVRMHPMLQLMAVLYHGLMESVILHMFADK